MVFTESGDSTRTAVKLSRDYGSCDYNPLSTVSFTPVGSSAHSRNLSKHRVYIHTALAIAHPLRHFPNRNDGPGTRSNEHFPTRRCYSKTLRIPLLAYLIDPPCKGNVLGYRSSEMNYTSKEKRGNNSNKTGVWYLYK